MICHELGTLECNGLLQMFGLLKCQELVVSVSVVSCLFYMVMIVIQVVMVALSVL